MSVKKNDRKSHFVFKKQNNAQLFVFNYVADCKYVVLKLIFRILKKSIRSIFKDRIELFDVTFSNIIFVIICA